MIRSYRSAFILTFALFLVLTTGLVGFNAYRRAADVSLGLSTEIIDQISQKVGERTVGIFEAGYGYLEMNALLVAPGGMGADRDTLFRLFWRQLELEPHLESLFVAAADGGFLQVRNQPQLVTRFIDRSGERPREALIYRDSNFEPIAHIEGGGLFDPRQRSWYVGALAAQGSVTWSSVYRFADTYKPGVTASKLLYDPSGKPALVIGVDIALEGLSEFIAEQPLPKGAVAMIVDEADTLVAYPFQLKLRERDRDAPANVLPKVQELADPALVAAYEQLVTASEAEDARQGRFAQLHRALTEQLSGPRYIARLHHFPSHWTDGWKLFVVVPEASLLTTAGRLLSESAVISLIILIGAVLLVSLLAMRLFKPLSELVRNTELVKQMRFSEVQPVKSRFVEIQAMDAAICGMKQSLSTLEKFVPASVARELIASGAEVEPGGEVVELTLFGGGMAEFGALCRAHPPELIIEILTQQLDRSTRVLLRERATVDNYLGEGILAFWGAPTAVENAGSRACQAVLQCLAEEARRSATEPRVPARLTRNHYALHRGSAIVGNIGSQRHLSYTAVGDSVELTWRLKQLNHLYGTSAIVSQTLAAEIRDAFWLRHLDRLPAEHGHESLDIYQLQGQRTIPLPAEEQLFSRAYERGLQALLGGDWSKATEVFETLARERGDDPSVALMLRRCRERRPLPCVMGGAADTPNLEAAG